MRRALGLLAAIVAAPLAAQQPVARNCVVQIDSAGVAYGQGAQSATPQWYAGRGVFARCREQSVTMRSDSLAWFSDRGELRLLGRVHFEDTVAVLDADKVTYWVRQERLVAEGNVYTRNLRTHSDLRGPNLDYLRAVPPIRDTLEIYAPGRPHIHFYAAADSLKPDSLKEPFLIVGDRVWMRGQERMWASGHVTIDRSDLAARADSAALNLRDSFGLLVGSPVVTAKDTVPGRDSVSYRLSGQRIRFEMTTGQQIRRVLSMGNADAIGPDWHLTSDTLDLALDSSRIQRAQAWGRGEQRAVAHSELSTITADSLDIQMPGQVMDLVLAYGNARAVSKPDSTQEEDDWLTGDSLRATFAPVDSASQARRSEIRRVIAFGTTAAPARSYYHIENEQDRQGRRGISYSRGQRINIAMRERKVKTVDIVGRVDGVYLEPLPPGADTTGADSTRADSTRAGTPAPQPAPRPARPPARPRPRTEPEDRR
jgi:lipopolysaccharide export system protein LptA